MTADARPPLTDSPWFWVLAFSLMALLALAAMSGKYGQRQAREELKYQASERIASGERGDAASSDASGRRPYSSPGQTLIPLWPLAVIMVAISLIALTMLRRDLRRYNGADNEVPP
jgi:hypothetical protein